ncbi:MAG: hypothetical protein GY749_27415 [Desulfobacteraceae bacterium]|nr:hypothetical protein [Desulfobacteraceae bacterium]
MEVKIDISPIKDRIRVRISYGEEEKKPVPEISAVKVYLWYERAQIEGMSLREIEKKALEDAPGLIKGFLKDLSE